MLEKILFESDEEIESNWADITTKAAKKAGLKIIGKPVVKDADGCYMEVVVDIDGDIDNVSKFVKMFKLIENEKDKVLSLIKCKLYDYEKELIFDINDKKGVIYIQTACSC